MLLFDPPALTLKTYVFYLQNVFICRFFKVLTAVIMKIEPISRRHIPEARTLLYLYVTYIGNKGPRGSVVVCGIMLQTGRSRVRFSMKSLDFLIDLILPAVL
jgi:hypothetical protein